MADKSFILIIMSSVKATVKGELSGHVVGGDYAEIREYAHSAFLTIECQTTEESSFYICGGSILNYAMVLTAAHCLEGCLDNSKITVIAGHVHRKRGYSLTAENFIVHELYNSRTVANDVGLVKMKGHLPLSKQMSRVVLMRKPPRNETAYIAGWGLTDEENFKQTVYLKFVSQKLWTRRKCREVLKTVPKGAFCAGARYGNEFAAQGDSGSALMIRKFIQIGLVSFKNPSISRSLVVYSDIGYHCNWIEENIKFLHCGQKLSEYDYE